MLRYEVSTYYDDSPENPTDGSNWDIHSFSTKHTNHTHPDHFRNEHGQVAMRYRNKVRAGTMYFLSYYEHGACAWYIQRDLLHCGFDNVDTAGALLWTGKPKDLATTIEERTKIARSLLECYTSWCNGQVYGYTVDRVTSCERCSHQRLTFVDGVSGFYDQDALDSNIMQAIRIDAAGKPFEIIMGDNPLSLELESLTS